MAFGGSDATAGAASDDGASREPKRWFATADGVEPAVEVEAGNGEVRFYVASSAESGSGSDRGSGPDTGPTRVEPGPGAGMGPGTVVVRHAGRSVVAFASRHDGAWHVEVEGRHHVVRVDDERTHRLRELTAGMAPPAGPPELRAPMPGLVVRVAVAVGDRVAAGDGLIVMEAMKMENELRAERDGVVADVRVSEGQTVDRDDVLVAFDLEET